MSEVDHTKRGRHAEIDHSIYPDKRTLNVRGREFVVSGTYLAVRSAYFRRFFYGDEADRDKDYFTIDADPDTFEDLIDIVYPYSKSTSCCVDCSSKLEERLELAVRLELDGAIEKLISHIKSRYRMLDVFGVLDNIGGLKYASFVFRDFFKDLASFEGYFEGDPDVDGSRLSEVIRIQAADYFGERRMEHAALGNNSDVLHIVEDFYPDSRTVLVSGKERMVSATTLSMHSGKIKELFLESPEGRLEIPALSGMETFEAFVMAAYGKNLTSDEISVGLLNACSVLDVPSLYDDLLKTVEKAVSKTESRLGIASRLLRHAAFSGKLENNYIIRFTMHLSEAEIEDLLPQFDEDSQIRIKELLDAANLESISITIRSLTGSCSEFRVSAYTSVYELKKMIDDERGCTPDQQRLIYEGKQIENSRTLMDYGISDKSLIHIVMKLRC